MEVLVPLIKTAHIGVALIMIVVILIQPGGSDELGTVFGGGTSESVFGAGGATTFLAKATRFMAVIFVMTSLLLGYSSFRQSSSSVFDKGGGAVEAPAEKTAPE
ncbi:MAG: preprotein translocase subunit SecG [Thermodesulfobacteriota bacterium]